jgi:ABC-type branched-subunit amino acid transport system substrate-binding protein/DNA-binding SARP family transcriptional activator
MEFRVLGPLEVIDGGSTLPLGGRRQRVVLAYLILDANRVVSTDQLIDGIWGDEPPDAARETLSAYVSRLRKLLGTGRIEARPPGYVLVAERSEVDVFRFTDLVDAARRETDGAKAVRLLTQALDLWRGRALADLTDNDALRPAVTRLEELRLGALEDRVAADLDLGRHREVVSVLEGLTREHPLRERLWSQLMLALYRSGRQGDALGAFHRARKILVGELGIDPSPELRRLHDQVLQQDSALDLAVARERPTEVSGVNRVPVATPLVGSPVPTRAAANRLSRRLALLGALGAVMLAAAATVWWAAAAKPTGLPKAAWSIGLDMPLSGPDAALGQPVRNAVQMAVDDLNAAGGVAGATLELQVLDDARDPDTAAGNARTFVDNHNVIAMIGPWGSAATFPVIPITNDAGLLECSPSSTYPGLTKPRYGALDVRAAHPDAINFVRLAPSDDIQAVAMASFAFRDLGAHVALVVDDTGSGGRDIADAFESEFHELGGSTVRRALNPGGDPRTVLAPLADELNPPGLVFYGGEPEAGAGLRQAMADAGRLATAMLSWDALLYDVSGVTRAYIDRLGPEAAAGSYIAHASLPDHKFSFADAYRQRFGAEPDEYSAAGYACVEIVAAALRSIATQGPRVDEVRELVRAYAVDPAHRYETILGTVGFDANGDALQQFVTFYRVDPSAAGGSGDWVFFKKQDFGPAP